MSQCMDRPPNKKWPSQRGGHCGEVTISGGSTVNVISMISEVTFRP